MNKCVDFQRCSNCGGCYNICPTKAISVQETGMFYMPVIDGEKCIQCGLCAKICPVKNGTKKQNIISAYGAIHNDEQIVKSSSSGGVFTAIAEEVLARGGVVFGAAYTDEFKTVQMCSTLDKTLDELRRSKYVESLVGDSFQKVKTLLETNTLVLYCGAPCQIAGLKSFLQSEYDNLITCDFSCGGMPSHKLYKQWLKGIADKLGDKVCDVNFRSKVYGWNNIAVGIKANNGKQYTKWVFADPYFNCFCTSHFSVRDYCLECGFANNHYADVILADFWKYKTASNIANYNKGISLVITNSPKGETIIQALAKKLALTQLDLEKASYNLVEKKCSDERLNNRRKFLHNCEQFGFYNGAKELKLKNTIVFKMKHTVKKIIGRE